MMNGRGPIRPGVAPASELRSDAQGGALCHLECEGCGGTRASGQPLCKRCMFTLPGGVAYDIRSGVAGAFEYALRILHS